MEISGKQFTAFLGGMFITAIFYLAIIFFYVLTTFSLAGETLTEKENGDTFRFFTAFIIVGITTFILVRKIRSGQPFTAIGMSLPLALALYGMIVSGITCIDNIYYHRSFNKQKWDNTEFKPFKMTKTIVKEKKLIGMSHKELFKLLGSRDNDYWNDKNYMVYPTDNPGWRLEIGFTNGKVQSAYLYEGGFDD